MFFRQSETDVHMSSRVHRQQQGQIIMQRFYLTHTASTRHLSQKSDKQNSQENMSEFMGPILLALK